MVGHGSGCRQHGCVHVAQRCTAQRACSCQRHPATSNQLTCKQCSARGCRLCRGSRSPGGEPHCTSGRCGSLQQQRAPAARVRDSTATPSVQGSVPARGSGMARWRPPTSEVMVPALATSGIHVVLVGPLPGHELARRACAMAMQSGGSSETSRQCMASRQHGRARQAPCRCAPQTLATSPRPTLTARAAGAVAGAERATQLLDSGAVRAHPVVVIGMRHAGVLAARVAAAVLQLWHERAAPQVGGGRGHGSSGCCIAGQVWAGMQEEGVVRSGRLSTLKHRAAPTQCAGSGALCMGASSILVSTSHTIQTSALRGPSPDSPFR